VDRTLGFLVAHGYLLTFAWVLTEQLGVPAPATPLLLAAGALVRDGRLSAIPLLAISIVACLIAHLVWYEAGLRRGARVLGLICRISIEPDACVRQTRELFARQGDRALILAYFIPAFDTIAQPLAAMSGMPRRRFLALNAIGAALWSAAFLGGGFLLGPQLERGMVWVERVGGSLAAFVAIGIALWIGWKLLERTRIVRMFRMKRVTPAELRALSSAAIVDLRHPLEIASDPRVIPGAVVLRPEEVESWADALPPERPIVLYCT